MKPRRHVQGGHAGYSFAQIYSCRVMCDNVGLRWLSPPKSWGCVNVCAHKMHACTHSNLQEKSGAWQWLVRARTALTVDRVPPFSFHRTCSGTGLSHVSSHCTCGEYQGGRMYLTSSGAGVLGTFSQTCPWYTHGSHNTRRAPTRHAPGRQGRGTPGRITHNRHSKITENRRPKSAAEPGDS
jgi:hypothetical protein